MIAVAIAIAIANVIASVRPQDGTERFIKRSSITSLCQKKGPHKGPSLDCKRPYIFATRVTNTCRGAPVNRVCAIPVVSLLLKPLLPIVEM